MFDQPTPGGPFLPAYPGPVILPQSDKPPKDLPPTPSIPGQDDEAPILTAFNSSHEQLTDDEPSWEPKPQPLHVPENPPGAFNFKSLRPFKPSKTSSSESSNKVTAISLKKLTKRFLPSSKRKPQQSNDYDDGEWDWDLIAAPSLPPPITTAGNHDPSNDVNRDGAELVRWTLFIVFLVKGIRT